VKRTFASACLVALVAVGLAIPGAGAAPVKQGWMVGSTRPLTSAQVSALQAAGASIKYRYRNFGGAAVMATKGEADAIRALPFVTGLSREGVRHPLALGASALANDPYWLDQVDREGVRGGYDGTGVWVPVMDEGLQPDWRTILDPAHVLEEYGMAFQAEGGAPNPNQWDVGAGSHGTAVAATIIGHRFADATNEGGWGTGYVTGRAGTYWVPGVAEGAQIIPLKVCQPIGCFDGAIFAAYDYITSLKLANPDQPMVVNESLGGGSLSAVEKAAVDAMLTSGVVLVASAGNGGTAGMGYPAAYEPVISVGAGGWTQQWDTFPSKTWWLDEVPETGVDEVYIPSFSSRELPGQYLDVVSTGRYLLLPYLCPNLYSDTGAITSATVHKMCAGKSTTDASQQIFEYLFISGTSFSAPAATGVVALMMDKDPTLSNADARFGTGDPSSWGPGSLERLLESVATPIPSGSVTVTHRTGDPLTETWGPDATGHGWLFADDAVAAA
jgi:hypothetical protein